MQYCFYVVFGIPHGHQQGNHPSADIHYDVDVAVRSSLSTDCGSTRSFRTKSIGNQVLFKKTMQHWESFRAVGDTQLLAVFSYSRRLLDIVGFCTMFYHCVSADPSYVYLSKCDERTHRYYFLIYDFIDRESDL